MPDCNPIVAVFLELCSGGHHSALAATHSDRMIVASRGNAFPAGYPPLGMRIRPLRHLGLGGHHAAKVIGSLKGKAQPLLPAGRRRRDQAHKKNQCHSELLTPLPAGVRSLPLHQRRIEGVISLTASATPENAIAGRQIGSQESIGLEGHKPLQPCLRELSP